MSQSFTLPATTGAHHPCNTAHSEEHTVDEEPPSAEPWEGAEQDEVAGNSVSNSVLEDGTVEGAIQFKDAIMHNVGEIAHAHGTASTATGQGDTAEAEEGHKVDSTGMDTTLEPYGASGLSHDSGYAHTITPAGAEPHMSEATGTFANTAVPPAIATAPATTTYSLSNADPDTCATTIANASLPIAPLAADQGALFHEHCTAPAEALLSTPTDAIGACTQPGPGNILRSQTPEVPPADSSMQTPMSMLAPHSEGVDVQEGSESAGVIQPPKLHHNSKNHGSSVEAQTLPEVCICSAMGFGLCSSKVSDI